MVQRYHKLPLDIVPNMWYNIVNERGNKVTWMEWHREVRNRMQQKPLDKFTEM